MGGPGTQSPGSSWGPVSPRSTQKTQGYLSEDTSMNSSVPFCSGKKATAQRPRSGLRAFLDPYGNLEQVGKW